MLGKVVSEEDIYNLISDLKGVHSLSLASQMLFNAEKGRVIHFGHEIRTLFKKYGTCRLILYIKCIT